MARLSKKEKMQKAVLLNHLIRISVSMIRRSDTIKGKTLEKFCMLWAELSATIMSDWIGDLDMDEYMEVQADFDKHFGPDAPNGYDTDNFNSIPD
tara:strand:+ start:338 stop:622 length:285 start_codon:yes stop_codon:yes gene_type:complete